LKIPHVAVSYSLIFHLEAPQQAWLRFTLARGADSTPAKKKQEEREGKKRKKKN